MLNSYQGFYVQKRFFFGRQFNDMNKKKNSHR